MPSYELPFFKAYAVAALWEKYSQKDPLSQLAEGNPLCLKAYAAQNSMPIREISAGLCISWLASGYLAPTKCPLPLRAAHL